MMSDHYFHQRLYQRAKGKAQDMDDGLLWQRYEYAELRMNVAYAREQHDKAICWAMKALGYTAEIYNREQDSRWEIEHSAETYS